MKPVIGILAHPPYTHVENKFNQISCNYTNSVYDAGGLAAEERYAAQQISMEELLDTYAHLSESIAKED